MAQKSLQVPGATVPSNEDGQPQALVISAVEGLVIKNGSTGSVTVKLPCQPSQNVTVKTTVIGGSGKLTVSSGASLTFTTSNWNTPQTVTFQSTAAQAGWERALVAPSGADVPGFQSVAIHIMVS